MKILNLKIVLSGITHENEIVDFVFNSSYDEDSRISRRMLMKDLNNQFSQEITDRHCYEITSVKIEVMSVEPIIIDCKDLELVKI